MDGRRSLSQLELESRPTYIIYKNILEAVVQCRSILGVNTSKLPDFFALTKPYRALQEKLSPLQASLINLQQLISPFEETRPTCSDLLEKHRKTEAAQERVNELTKTLSQLESDQDIIQDGLEEQSRQLNEQIHLAQSEDRTEIVEAAVDNIVETDTLEGEISDLKKKVTQLNRDINGHCCGLRKCNADKYNELDDIEAELRMKETEKRRIYEERARKKAEKQAAIAAAQSKQTAIKREHSAKIEKLKADIELVNQQISDHLRNFPEKIRAAREERDKRQAKFDKRRLEQDNYEIEFNCAINIPLLVCFLQCNLFWNEFRREIDAQITHLKLYPQEDKAGELTKFEAMTDVIKRAEVELDIQSCLDHLWCFESQDHRLAYFYERFTQLPEDTQTWLRDTKLFSKELLPKTLANPLLHGLIPNQPATRLQLLKDHREITIDSAPYTLIHMLRKQEAKIVQELITITIEEDQPTLRVGRALH